MKKKFLICSALLVIGIIGRVIPHPPNFTPIGGIIIFSMLSLENRFLKFFIPILVFWVSDLIINNITLPLTYPQYYQGFQLFGNWSIYLALFSIMLGLKLFLNNRKKYLIPRSSLIAATLFFLITNFGVWLGSSFYPPTFSGFLICLGAGVPFFGNNLLSTLIYSYVLIMGYDLIFENFSIKKYFS